MMLPKEWLNVVGKGLLHASFIPSKCPTSIKGGASREHNVGVEDFAQVQV